MKNITTRQFSILGDCGKIYQFMLDIYERDWRNGVAAPFFEYAYSSFSYWMDISYSYKNRIWEDNGEIVAFCFYENPVTDICFSLKPGYEELAPEMIAYADEHMPKKDGKNQLTLSGGQTALINAAKELGYRQVYELNDMQFDFEDVLDYPLPEGFHFVKPEEYDMDKISKCCWKGFESLSHSHKVRSHRHRCYSSLPVFSFPHISDRIISSLPRSEDFGDHVWILYGLHRLPPTDIPSLPRHWRQ